MLSNETVVFAQSKITSGSASCIVLAVGDSSSAKTWQDSRLVEEDQEEDNDLTDKHDSILQLLICVLFLVSGLLLVQCGIRHEIDWWTAT